MQTAPADGDILLREGTARLLTRSGFDVVGLAGDGQRQLALARETAPKLVMVDIRIPPTHTTDGLEAAREVRKKLPGTAVLELSAQVEVEQAMELLPRSNGIGYRLKSGVTDVDEFFDTLERVVREGSVVDPAPVQELVSARGRDDALAVLGAQEREVLALMAEERSNASIARRLWVTEGTVEKHIRSILLKLNFQETDDDHRRVLAGSPSSRPLTSPRRGTVIQVSLPIDSTAGG